MNGSFVCLKLWSVSGGADAWIKVFLHLGSRNYWAAVWVLTPGDAVSGVNVRCW